MRPELARLLPHEIFFGAFLVVMWLRLLYAVGPLATDTLVFFVLIVVNGLLIAAAERRPTRARWMARLLFYAIAMNVVFQQLRTAIPAVHPGKADLALQEIDRHIVGGNLSLVLQPYTHPVVTEILSTCYILFFPYLLFSLVWYYRGDETLLKKFCAGLFSLYGIGFFGYSLVPAAGPYVAMAGQFTVPIVGYKITQWNDALVRMGSNGVDVFPSLHCAVSTFFLAFDYRHRRWRFWAYLVPAVGLWISTIYLRYHYFIDVVAGFALAALAMTIANRYEARTQTGRQG
jgi:membrane-associated phospholipid phosphatase